MLADLIRGILIKYIFIDFYFVRENYKKKLRMNKTDIDQGGRGILIGWFIKLSVHKLQPLIVIYRRSFVYHNWECTSIYHQLSYPFRSLNINGY